MPTIRKSSLFVCMFIFLYGFVLYSNTFRNSFHFDDFEFIVQNPELSNILDIKSIWNEGSAPTRFIAYLTFALNYHINGYDLFGYHLVNILIHIINACLIYWLTLLLIDVLVEKKFLMEDKKIIIAVMTAGTFLTHPIQTQAVTYICQRFASLATLFYLLAVCLYIKARTMAVSSRRIYYIFAICSGVAGMFTKQIVMTLPITIMLVEGIFFNSASQNKIRLNVRIMFILILLALFLMIPMVYSFNIHTILFREYPSLSHSGDTLNLTSYFLTQARVIWVYIRILFFPIGQNLLYDFPASYSLLGSKVLPGISGIILLVYLSIRYRKQNPLICLGILWFFTTLLVESSIIPIRHVIFEHRCYLPLYGFSLCTTTFLVEKMKNQKKLWAVCSIIVFTLSFLTYKRNQIWLNDVTLWRDVISKSPKVIRPYTHLATAYLKQKEYQKALDTFTRAIMIDPQQAESYNNRGNVYTVLNQYDLALKDYLKALSIDPTLEKTYNNIGIIYNKNKDFSLALRFYDRALDLNPGNAGVYFNRANVYLQLDQLDKAFDDYSRCIKLDPFKKKAFYYRAQIYAVQGKFKEALADIEKAQDLGLKVDKKFIDQFKIMVNQR